MDTLGMNFQTLDVTKCRRLLSQLHQQVCGGKIRIEITRRGCENTCVIISKAELESLEQALAILADTNDFKEMCNILSQVATETTVPTPQFAPA